MKTPGKMLAEVLNHLFRKPATENYPFVKHEMPQDFRGMVEFVASRCIGCKLCVRDCPADAIKINKVGDKRFECTIELDHCLYCAQCVDSCNKEALVATKKFELAQLDRSKLKVTFEVLPKDEVQPAAAKPGAER